MTEDVYEPLARYRDEFREKFARLAREKFNELTARSGVDVRANRALVAEIRRLQRQADSAGAKKTCYGCLMAVGFVCAALALIGVLAMDDADKQVQGMRGGGALDPDGSEPAKDTGRRGTSVGAAAGRCHYSLP